MVQQRLRRWQSFAPTHPQTHIHVLTHAYTPHTPIALAAILPPGPPGNRPKIMEGASKGKGDGAATSMLQQPYLRVVGLTEDNEGHKAHAFT